MQLSVLSAKMAGDTVLTSLKDLPMKFQTSSLKERHKITSQVRELLSKPDLDDHLIRGLCKTIQSTLLRYRDTTSQSYIKQLILVLCKNYRDLTLQHFVDVLTDVSNYLRRLSTSSGVSQSGLIALKWSSILIENTAPQCLSKSELSELVIAQSLLLTTVTAFGNEKKNRKATSMLHQMWLHIEKDSELAEMKWLDVLTKQSTDSGPDAVIMTSAICKHLQEVGRINLVEKYKAHMCESFIKSFVSVKARPNSNLIKACKVFLNELSNDELKNSIMPALQKSMLRNPELIIEAVGSVFESLDSDLSPFALEIGKLLIGNLSSKEELVRSEAAVACKSLSSKCSDEAFLGKLIKHLFEVLNGVNGKLTLSEHKIGLLLGAGNFSCNQIEDKNLQKLIQDASLCFIRVLESETHEKTLCYALEIFSLWTEKLIGEVPDYIINAFKKGLNLKSSTPLVRVAYMEWFAKSIGKTTMADSNALSPILSKSIEKAIQQPSQVTAVSEGIAAAYIMIKIDKKREVPTKMSAIWNAIIDKDKQIFLNDKFLSTASDDVMEMVILLCCTAIKNYSNELNGRSSTVQKALVLALLSLSRSVRKVAVANVKELLLNSNQIDLSRSLVAQLNSVLEENKFNQTADSNVDDVSSLTVGKIIGDSIITICTVFDYSNEEALQLLAIDALPCSHHPLVKAANLDLWLKVVKDLKLAPKKLILRYANNLKNTYINGFVMNKTYTNVIATLCAINPEVVFPYLVSSAVESLKESDLLSISMDEYYTFLTPEGVLYDQSVIPGNEDAIEINMKRESKVYSYKDQLEEQQLRRELGERRRKEGKVKETNFTPKQKEAIKAQTNKENAIRQRLTILDNKVRQAYGLLCAAMEGNKLDFSIYMRTLLPPILIALQSPLASQTMMQLFLKLRQIVYYADNTMLGEMVAHITVRLHKPRCEMDPNWEEENLSKAISRTIKELHARTVQFAQQIKKENDTEPKSTLNLSKECFLTGPAFSYSFPLLKLGLNMKYSKNDNDLVHCGLQIISHHSKLRGSTETTIKDLYHPSLLPIEQIFQFLIDLISCTSGRNQMQCSATLLDIANCASGKEGCSTASVQEVACLLSGLQSPSEVVRDACLRALSCLTGILHTLTNDTDQAITLMKRLWIAKHDESADLRSLADPLWSAVAIDAGLGETLAGEVLRDILHPAEPVQRAAARAFAALLGGAAACDVGPGALAPADALDAILAIYDEKLELVPPRLDEFGRVAEEAVDEWGGRRGAALALLEAAPLLRGECAAAAVRFFVARGLADRAEPVRAEMLSAAMALVELHGAATVDEQLPVFEDFLDRAPKSSGYDAVRQAVVLLVGSLARHLRPGDARVRPIALRLVAALGTPSQRVQEAVSECLPPLIASPALADDVPAIVNKLMNQLLKAEKYGDRKGAAYGIAGVVKGLGILALKQLDIMAKLTEAIQEKKNYRYREGALFAFEMLCTKLGRLFEPYIVHVLPHLLMCFGDSSQYVRAATDDTAKVIMSKLSAHGVKLVLPSLLSALEDDSWRTKTGSVELLGAMAYCAPKQLSSCLPSIVPKLIEVLSDSHTKVQAAGAEALKVIGSVIRNPEIQAIVPVLLQALQDPSNKTSACLQTLLDTQFVHFIDAPSLALIMPVVQRAFMDRSTETRKMAAQIIGNMYSLTDQKDLMPYLPNIIPGLKMSLLDPVPEVRSVSARALGAMVRGMGESSFEDLLPWLMQTLTSETSSVDRSGAAQGLSEVVAGLGVEKLHKLMPEVIATAERTDIAPHVKDGYIMMFIYMPGAFTEEFTPYIGQIINPILKALADENEYVRETALKAGQRIVNLYADSVIALFLPELENGLFDDNWRIRYSSVQLLGDLLYRISGVSGKMSTETASEDDNFGTEQSHSAIMTALGAERRNRVLAGLYMGRSDVALMVRQSALHVWKVVVTNTPRTLREILPTLFGLLLGCLASTSYDKRQVAARTLGDLVRKLGERVLPEIIPILERGLQSDRADQRQGVCIGLGEIMASTNRDMVLAFVDSLVPTVRRALCDPLPEVRAAAAKTFDGLHQTVGSKAVDEILPFMLAGLDDPDPLVAEAALDGLEQVMALKSRVVLPYLIPQLTAPPVNTRALSALAAAAGDALGKHLHRVLPALLTALMAAQDTAEEARETERCRGALLAISEEAGVRAVVDTLLEASRSPEAAMRRAAAALLCAFCAHTRADIAPHVHQLLRGLLLLFADADRNVLVMAREALQAVTKTLDAERQIQHVQDVRQAVRYAAGNLEPGEPLPGFCLPKGITPILPLFRESILNGLPEDKENAALMLGEIIRLTSATAIQPSVVHITGPLIRILGDRFAPNVKAAVLETLALLLAKVGVMLKQFLPQLQTTFLKSLNDTNRQVRIKAGYALSQLVVIHTRADPLFVEMHNGIKNTDDPAVRETMLQALRGVIAGGGEKMSEALTLNVLNTLTGPNLLGHSEDPPRSAVGGCVGAMLHILPLVHLDQYLHSHVLNLDAQNWELLHGRSAALFVALKEHPESIYLEQYEEKITKVLLSYLTSDKIPVVCSGILGIGYLIKYIMSNNRTIPQSIIAPFVRTMNHQSNDVKQLIARASAMLGRRIPSEQMAPEFLKLLIPTLVNGTKEKNGYVKANSEIALISVLRLRKGDEFQQKCLSLLDVGARESLNDVICKVLRKCISQPEGKEEELDSTLLS